MPYFRQEWNNSKKLVYTQSYNDIIKNFKKWNGEEVDLIYSMTYPYNMSMDYNKNSGEVIPKCVFYTSEYSKLDSMFFQLVKPVEKQDDYISGFLKENNNIYFTCMHIK